LHSTHESWLWTARSHLLPLTKTVTTASTIERLIHHLFGSYTPNLTMSDDPNIDSAMIQEPCTATNTGATGFLDLPPEIVLQIFHQTASGDSSQNVPENVLQFFHQTTYDDHSQDVMYLAISSKRTYQIFKENELAILRRAVIQLVGRWGNSDGALANYIIKMGILRLAKPWPSRPDDLERALATAADSATPIDLPPGMNVSLIDWVKLIRKPGAVPHAYRSDWVGLPLPARRWIEDRGSFAGKHRLTEPNPRSAHHPYNCVNPREIVVVMSRKGPLVYSPPTKELRIGMPATQISPCLTGSGLLLRRRDMFLAVVSRHALVIGSAGTVR
jgi:hypothetical protein